MISDFKKINMAFALKVNKTTIVPWFSMSEWEKVYKQVYSDDEVEQKQGYERLLVWKARCPDLPAGVECTLGLIHVCLQDREIWPQIVSGALPPYREHDLRLMYSTAIMRFLNHISIVAQDGTETMYKMAKNLHIPDWVVNIRHDVAHGSSLPPLAVLREAMNFTLDWIHEHYWKGEAEMTNNYFANHDSDANVTVIQQLLAYIELWQALKLYDDANYTEVKNIPDDELKLQLYKKMETSPKRRQSVVMPNFEANGNNIATENGYPKSILDDCKTKDVLYRLMKQLATFVKQNQSVLNGSEQLVTALLGGESLLPGEDILASLNMDVKESLPRGLKQLWHHLLMPLQTVNILPILLKKLLELTCKTEENSHRRKAAALWIKELCIGLLKARKLHTLTEEYRFKNGNIKLKGKKAKKVQNHVQNVFEKAHPEWADVFSLKMVNLPEININLVEQIMLTPNKWTHIFLPSLLDLLSPAIPPSAKENLLGVLEVYTSEVIPIHEWDVELDAPPVYTVDTLAKETPVEESCPGGTTAMDVDGDGGTGEQEPRETDDAYLTGWEKSEAYLDWENCPLGVLPWQRDLTSIDFGMPRDTLWKPVRPRVAFENVKRGLPGHFQKSINWDEILLKKRLKKNKHAGVNYVKKAFQTVVGR